MNFLADESVDFPIILHLRERGYDVLAVAEKFPSKDDEYVLETASQADRILLTSDKDFGELVYRLKKVSAGVILLRVEELYPNEKAELLLKVIEERSAELPKSFTVIKKEMVRIRRI